MNKEKADFIIEQAKKFTELPDKVEKIHYPGLPYDMKVRQNYQAKPKKFCGIQIKIGFFY